MKGAHTNIQFIIKGLHRDQEGGCTQEAQRSNFVNQIKAQDKYSLKKYIFKLKKRDVFTQCSNPVNDQLTAC